jgi:hypothetical protein
VLHKLYTWILNIFLTNLDRFCILTSFILPSSWQTTTFWRTCRFNNRVLEQSNVITVLHQNSEYISNDIFGWMLNFYKFYTTFHSNRVLDKFLPIPLDKLPYFDKFWSTKIEFWTKLLVYEFDTKILNIFLTNLDKILILTCSIPHSRSNLRHSNEFPTIITQLWTKRILY